MKLDGYRCDNCKTESSEKPGVWYSIQTMHVKHGGWRVPGGGFSSNYSGENHYCSRQCLVDAMPEEKKK